MKKQALAFCFLLGLALPAQANQIMRMTAACQQSDRVHDFITQEYEEIPFSQGPAVIRLNEEQYAEGNSTIYVNPKTKGFSVVIEFPEDDVACILLMGDDFKPAIQGEGA